MPTVQYLREYAGGSVKQFPWSNSLAVIISAFQAVTANKLRLACRSIERRKAGGSTAEEATNMTGLELIRVAEIHGRWFVLQSAYEMFEKAYQKASPQMASVMKQLCKLVVYDEALKISGDLLRVSRGFYIGGEHIILVFNDEEDFTDFSRRRMSYT